MRRIFIIAFTGVLALGFACAALGGDGVRRGKLNAKQAETLAAELWNRKKAALKAEYGRMWNNRTMELNNLRMPFWYAVYGEKPSSGRSLYISLHGGGNVPAEVNDQQWENQKGLYRPAEGVYMVPRSAVNDLNMWLRPHIDTLFEMIIRLAVVMEDVDPDKVYLMGYSAGGDGVYRMAPRLADHWAAASMMAGHPGESSPVNLRNIGYMIWMGGKDRAYNRNTLAAEYGRWMDDLQRADPEGYVHETHILPECGHWMNRADTAAVSWMSRFRRNPYPDHIVWRQEMSNPRPSFYYLSVPDEEAVGGREVRLYREGNTFTVTRNDFPTLRIWLNDRFVDLSKPVRVVIGGREVFCGKVKRRAEHIAETVDSRVDPDYIFSAVLEIRDGKCRAL